MDRLLILVFLGVIMIGTAIPFIARSLLWNRVLKRLNHGEYDGVLKLLNSAPFKLFFSEYDREYNTLRVYLARSENRKIEEQTKKLLDMKLSKGQSYQVASQTYYYFLDRENKETCLRLLDALRTKAQEEEMNYSQMLFRVLIEKKSEDIDFVKKLLDEKEAEKVKKNQVREHEVQTGLLQYLLGLQYIYSKDRKQGEVYLNKARGNLKGTPYHKKVKQMLGKV